MRLLLFIGIVVISYSCRTQRAVYNYLEDVNDSVFRKSVYISETIVQKNDLLSIQIFSDALKPETDVIYNLPSGAAAMGTMGGAAMPGYLVDVSGDIVMPRIGIIHAEGLKKSELEAEIKRRIGAELVNPKIMIRFLNFRVTVLGEVGGQQVVTAQNERMTVLEAISLSGGITEFGTIKEVRVLRENNGVRGVGFLDLTKSNIFTSPYYQLQQNDVVIVNQTKYKLRQTEQSRISQQVSFATSIISTIAVLIAVFR